MSRRNQQKRKARRAEKARQLRKFRNRSVFEKLGGEVECWITEAEEDNRMASIVAFREAGGETVSGYFLIDFDCIGLKDAYCRVGIPRSEVLDFMEERRAPEGVELVGIHAEEAREIVAGAIRWTREHEFRLPRDTERAVKVLGGVGEAGEADVGEFGLEGGGLLYVGRKRDLEDRLVGTTLEKFMARDDVECDFAFDRFAEEDLTEEELEEQEEADEAEVDFEELQEQLRQRMTAAVREWCFGKKLAPHPRLEEAVGLLLGTIGSATAADPDGGPADEENVEAMGKAMHGLMALEDAGARAELEAALGQVQGFMAGFASAEEMFKKVMPEGDLGGEE